MKQSNSFSRRYIDDLSIAENFHTEYNLASSLGIMEDTRFCRLVEGKLFATVALSDEKQLIGYLNATRLYIGEGRNNNWSAEDIFNSDDDTSILGKAIYDYDLQEANSIVNEFYEYDIIGLDILIIDNIEIVSKFRKIDLGAHFLKDFIMMFGADVGLIVLDVYPGQFREGLEETWMNEMKYDELSKDFDYSYSKLFTYFESLGFKSIPRIPRRYMFMNYGHKVDQFESIKLE